MEVCGKEKGPEIVDPGPLRVLPERDLRHHDEPLGTVRARAPRMPDV
jgi:hypothetical protein